MGNDTDVKTPKRSSTSRPHAAAVPLTPSAAHKPPARAAHATPPSPPSTAAPAAASRSPPLPLALPTDDGTPPQQEVSGSGGGDGGGCSSGSGREGAIRLHLACLVRHRRALEQKVALCAEISLIRGVSFHGRQETMLKLLAGHKAGLTQGMLASREPDNDESPKSVRIETPAGKVLGIVPEDRRDLFVRHEAVAGTVTSVGYKQRTDLIGSHVVFQVGLPALTVTLLPAEWDALIDAARARAEAGALAAAGGKCAITGAPQSEVVLAVVPVFRFDLKEESLEEWSECVTVVGWMAVAAPIAAAKRFDRIGTADGRAAALALIAKINGWSEEDARNYVAAAEAKRQQLQQEQWELVFEWPTGEQQQVKEPQHQIKQEGPEVKQEQPNVKEEQRKEVVVKREAVQQQQQEEDDGRRGAPDAEPAAKRQRRSLSPGADGGAAA